MTSFYNQIIIVIFITFGILITPIIFIGLDFWSGVRKAKHRGDKITSDGWKRTAYKIAKYYNMLIPLLILDLMQMAGFWYMNSYCGWSMPTFPFITLLGALFIGAIEVKSIYEPADEKERKEMRQVSELATEIAHARTDPQEIANTIIEYLNQHNDTDEYKKGNR